MRVDVEEMWSEFKAMTHIDNLIDFELVEQKKYWMMGVAFSMKYTANAILNSETDEAETIDLEMIAIDATRIAYDLNS
jgi:hypothetical protein